MQTMLAKIADCAHGKMPYKSSTHQKTQFFESTIIMIKYPSIEQFRHVIQQITNHTVNAPLPKLAFTGTVKLHGTHAGITYELANNQLTVQSRERVLNLKDDNAGFCAFVQLHKPYIISVFHQMYSAAGLSPRSTLTVFGEWCGGNIQKNVALNQLDKMFVVFDVLETRLDGTQKWHQSCISYWHCADCHIYHAYLFPTRMIEIDFAQPQYAIDELTAITEAVEQECPVGKYFGVHGMGEGMVWTHYTDAEPYRFKVKGSKTQVSKTQNLAALDVEQMANIAQFIAYALTENRLQQAIDVMKANNMALEPKNLGFFIKWLHTDIQKEEADTIARNQLNTRILASQINHVARDWFFKHYNQGSF